jgi:hypothetical protein
MLVKRNKLFSAAAFQYLSCSNLMFFGRLLNSFRCCYSSLTSSYSPHHVIITILHLAKQHESTMIMHRIAVSGAAGHHMLLIKIQSVEKNFRFVYNLARFGRCFLVATKMTVNFIARPMFPLIVSLPFMNAC